MPLMHGSGQHIIGANIAQLRKDGYPEKQAIAIAYNHAGKGRKKAKKSKKSESLDSMKANDI